MFKRHNHKWKEMLRTYSPPRMDNITRMDNSDIFSSQKMIHGVTTILWECQDVECQELRKEELLGKSI